MNSFYALKKETLIAQQTKCKTTLSNVEQGRTVKYECSIAGSNIIIKAELIITTTLNINLIARIEKFKIATSRCLWSQNVQTNLLESLIIKKVWTKILTKKNSEEIFMSFINLKYLESGSYIYIQNLENIKQEKYFYIEDYYLSLKEYAKILSIIKNSP
ncbi:hypothetical protein H312_01273 [Anncaliia algerae PRA339]|uniref:Uncharacterized protein n=1 Tax=Anncaliia algerae PRA339 TaxID=1288291 RepID=A0A059F2D6_9MICR|nr:hypothetical protein H312_01273 [Anncaliia algerae PRA339]